jgi:hypothetical protein
MLGAACNASVPQPAKPAHDAVMSAIKAAGIKIPSSTWCLRGDNGSQPPTACSNTMAVLLYLRDKLGDNASVSSEVPRGVPLQKRYRSWEERRSIISSIIAEENPPPIETFELSESEELYFRSKSRKFIENLAIKTSEFKSYYALPAANPFGRIIFLTLMILGSAGIAVLYINSKIKGAAAFPLYGALTAASIAALGWTVAGWIGHRNTVRQNTNNLLFARFSHAPFGDALHRFHTAFGVDLHPRITPEVINKLRNSACENDTKAAASVSYILNYYEFIATGVLNGDFDKHIVRDNIRGLIVFYHDKCAPMIYKDSKDYPRVFYNLKKIRTHYREP